MMIETKYYPAKTIAKEALCENCGNILKYKQTDFSKKTYCWLHICEKCGNTYWLDNRYPTIDYLVDTNTPLNIETNSIEYEKK